MQKQPWFDPLFENLKKSGEIGVQTATFLRERRTSISFAKDHPAVGAAWTAWRSIKINTVYFSPEKIDNPRLLSLVVHEARHLQQGLVTALSVYGELDAWQLDFGFQKSLTGKYPSPLIAELCGLPLAFDRRILSQARDLMQTFAGKGYRIDLLPLYPLPREIRYRLTKR
ncbi:MAG: hypothetical protein RBS68_11385 [Anaerolineales bacterium]|jgi:hypothetical protein|nr:hypothetical protein [Anaerolineales bacterium]